MSQNIANRQQQCMDFHTSVRHLVKGQSTNKTQMLAKELNPACKNQQTNLLCSSQGLKKTHPSDPSSKMPLWGGGGVGGHVRAHHPGHPFVQDPTMPPLSPPNTLTQLEEARRRLEEASKANKQR